MLAEKLIEQLQTAIINHDRVRYDDNGMDLLGPLEVYIDAFEPRHDNRFFEYTGYSRDISLDSDTIGAVIRWQGW